MYKSGFRWLITIVFALGLLITPVSFASAAGLKSQPAMLLAATGDGSPADSNIKYTGRWDNSDVTNIKSYWSGAYFSVNFTGTTLSIKLGGAVNMFAVIDGVTKYYASANGTVNLTPTALASGTHTLRIIARSESDTIQFKGLVLSSGASTQAPAAKSKLIEFIGDSITAGCCTLSNYVLNNYAWLTGEALNADHTQIAFSGICLQDAVSCYSENRIGMSVQFFKLQTVHYTNSPAWDFNRYQPNQVVINLGTNDSTVGVSDSTFQSTYTTFLQNIRAKYPNAEIYVLRTFGGYKVAPTQAAVNARISAGDSKVHYVDTSGWVTTGDFDSDNLHPNANGHIKIANRLQSVLGTAPVPTATRTSTPVPTNTPTGPTATPGTGPVSINVGGSATGSFTADQYFSGGTAFTNTNTIDTSLVGSVPAAVFQSERYGAFSYSIPRVAGSAQTVTLYFAETYLTAAGQRLFNVTINGTTVLSSFDIYASAGGQNKAISRTFNTTANSSGQVVIQFVVGTENPKVNGITVASGTGPTNTPTKTNTPGVPTNTPTRTNTPGVPTNTPVGPTNTPVVPTNTPTQGSGGGACSPVTSTITAPFSFDGAGTFCWQSSSLGSYINSWNTTSVTINGVNATNLYVGSGSYPAKINGFWYVSYNSSVAWSHFEAK